MKTLVFAALTLVMMACSTEDMPPSDDSPDATMETADARIPVYATETAAVDAYCVHLCQWADKCGGFYPDACGDLCTPSTTCEDACKVEVCHSVDCAGTLPEGVDDTTVEKCLRGVDASTSDCTEYRPNVPACLAFAGPAL